MLGIFDHFIASKKNLLGFAFGGVRGNNLSAIGDDF